VLVIYEGIFCLKAYATSTLIILEIALLTIM
jgi:hypothetical protein